MPNLSNPINNYSECVKVLQRISQGTLVLSKDREPYAVPMNHCYFKGKLYFHCSNIGRKLEIIYANPRVCYVVCEFQNGDEDHAKDNIRKCHGPWESAIVYGKARVIDEPSELLKAFKIFMEFYGVPDYTPSSEDFYKKTRIIEITIECMTVRRELKGQKGEFWSWIPGGEEG